MMTEGAAEPAVWCGSGAAKALDINWQRAYIPPSRIG
jgi:hypothetical protein